jgi:hypothetical protein
MSQQISIILLLSSSILLHRYKQRSTAAPAAAAQQPALQVLDMFDLVAEMARTTKLLCRCLQAAV